MVEGLAKVGELVRQPNLVLNWGNYYAFNLLKENELTPNFNAKDSPVERTFQPIQA